MCSSWVAAGFPFQAGLEIISVMLSSTILTPKVVNYDT
jgi:hypothetical protein